jgi:hypothetical protein
VCNQLAPPVAQSDENPPIKNESRPPGFIDMDVKDNSTPEPQVRSIRLELTYDHSRRDETILIVNATYPWFAWCENLKWYAECKGEPTMRRNHFSWPFFMTVGCTLVACGGKDNDPVTSDTSHAGTTATDSTVVGGTTGTTGTAGTTHAGGTGTSGGTSSGSVTTGGGSGGVTAMPSECKLDADAEAINILLPQNLTFNITNTRSSTLYLYTPANCSSWLSLYSCADNYKSAIAYSAGCSESCATSESSCIKCAPCYESYEAIAPGATVKRQWAGNYYTFETLTVCSCYKRWTALEGKYRVAVEVYSSGVSSEDNHSTTVTTDFGYPDPDGVVEVSL